MEIQTVQNQLVEDDFTTIASALQIKEQMIGNYKVQAVDGRQLWNALGVKTRFTDQAKDQIANNGYVENVDWTVNKISTSPIDEISTPEADEISKFAGSRTISVYTFPINVAKEIALMAKTEQGKFVRRYFIKMESIAQKAIQSKIPQTYIEALEETLRLARINEAQAAKLEYTTPRSEWVDTYISHNGKMTIKDFGKILCTNKINDVDGSIITSKSIYDVLRRYKYIGKKNQPNQKMINMKYMVIEPGLRTNPLNGAHICDKDGNTIPTYTTKITGRGETYLTRMLTIRINKDIKDLEEDNAAE